MNCTALSALTLSLTAAAAWAQSPGERFWPQWRGPTGNGTTLHGQPPTEWDATRNVRWKTELPGHGHATPIVWEDRIYLLTAIPVNDAGAPAEGASGARGPALAAQDTPPPPRQDPPREGQRRGRPEPRSAPTQALRFTVIALERPTGRIVWQRSVCEEVPHEGTHNTASFASASPITDGTLVYANFGSRGVYGLDLEGNVKWQKQLGKMKTRNAFGEGASPALHADTLVILWDHEGDDFIVALRASTGEELWRRPRDEPTTWCSPYIVEVNGTPQVIAPGTNRVCAYDLKTGELVWECGGLTANVIPTPVYAEGVAYVMSGFRGAVLKAIRLADARGKLADDSPAIVWSADQNTPYVPSPLLADGRLYFFDNTRPVLSCLDARDGRLLFGPQRIDGLENIYASPIAAGGHVYLVGRSGQTTVIKSGPTYAEVARNKLDDEFNASPVAVGNELYLRGRRHLYCIAKD